MLLSTILFIPLVGASALAAMLRWHDGTIRRTASRIAIADLLASLPLWLSYDRTSAGWQFVERHILIAQIGVSYHLGVDGFSALLVLLTTIVGAMAMAGPWAGVRERVRQYYACLLMLQAGVLGALMALDFLVFFLFWTGTLASIYYLIREWGGGEPQRSAVTFLAVVSVSSVILLAAILALAFYNHSIAGTYTFDVTQFQQLALPARWQAWIFAAFFAGFSAMAAMFPLHAALRRAQSDAPAAAAVVVAALSLNLGAYGFIRFSLPMLPDASRSFAPAVTVLALVSIVYTGLAALAQSDWKRLLAYASASQMGIIVAAIFALTPTALAGSVVQQIGHGLCVGGLFLLAGVLHEHRLAAVGSERAGTSSVPMIVTGAFSILALGTIAIPALTAYRYSTSRGWSVAAAAGVVLGAAAMVRLYRLTLSGPVANGSPLSAIKLASVVPLAASTIWIAAYPPAFISRLDSSVSRVMARVNNTAPANSSCDAPPAPPPQVPSPGPAASPPPDFLTFAACGEDEKPSVKPGGR